MEFLAVDGELTAEALEGTFKKMSAVLESSSQKWARIQEKKDPTPIFATAPAMSEPRTPLAAKAGE